MGDGIAAVHRPAGSSHVHVARLSVVGKTAVEPAVDKLGADVKSPVYTTREAPSSTSRRHGCIAAIFTSIESSRCFASVTFTRVRAEGCSNAMDSQGSEAQGHLPHPPPDTPLADQLVPSSPSIA